MSIFRDPPVESCDLYPGLSLHDERQTGSITVGESRLPLWAIIATVVNVPLEEKVALIKKHLAEVTMVAVSAIREARGG